MLGAHRDEAVVAREPFEIFPVSVHVLAERAPERPRLLLGELDPVAKDGET